MKWERVGNWCRCTVCAVVAVGIHASVSAPAQGWRLATNLTLNAGLTIKETYDNNVYILDSAPAPAVVPPAGFTISERKKDSFVTSVTPALALNYKPCAAAALTLSYAPEVATYHSAHSEDNVTHRGAVNLSGTIKGVSYESLNSVIWIDGSDLGPVTIRPGDCRAIGGIPLRDRRDALIFRDGLKVTVPAGKWFFRPVFSAYVHDFQTKQFPNSAPSSYIYDNFVDRWDVNGGLDVGFEVLAKTKLVAGWRYGHQHQGRLLGATSPYSSDYQRILFGVEGTPVSWLKLGVLAGPDFRDWCGATPAAFDRNELLWYVDATVTVLPTAGDTIALRATRYEQPAFTSHSIYEDIKYDLTWRHKLTGKWTVGAGLTVYIADWQAPVNREDLILTPSAMTSYAFNKHLTGELSWSYDRAINEVSTTAAGATYADGREFTRHLVSLAFKYTF